MQQIGIIGSGTMGSGIAQVAATAGYQVILLDTQAPALTAAEQRLQHTFQTLLAKGKISSQLAVQIRSAIQYTTAWAALATCDIVIEAIIEDLAAKQTLFRNIEAIIKPTCLVATNTSSLSVTAIAAACQYPERVLGIHFFNPAPLMQLVEIIPAIQTMPTYLAAAQQHVQQWQKLGVVAKDTPAFIVNRIARPFYSEALRIYEEGIADMPTIDWAMTALGGFKMGPFALMDFIGNDINYAVTVSVFNAFHGEPRYRPSFTQKRLIEANWLGRKTQKGYYNYTEGATLPSPTENMALGESIVQRIVLMLINEAADAWYYGIATREDIETAMTKGVNYPKGLLQWAEDMGIGVCIDRLKALYDYYQEDRYRCSPGLRRLLQQSLR